MERFDKIEKILEEKNLKTLTLLELKKICKQHFSPREMQATSWQTWLNCLNRSYKGYR